MQLQKPININSIIIVQDQLEGLIQSLQTSFEEYVIELNDTSKLDICADYSRQLSSIFQLLECTGGENFSDELTELVHYIKQEQPDEISKSITEYTQSLFILPRYIDYIVASHTDMPILLIEYINSMRAARGAQPYTEEDILALTPPKLSMITSGGEPALDELSKSIKRLRLMYQVGLVKVLKYDQLNPMVSQLLMRPVKMVANFLRGSEREIEWALAESFVQTITDKRISLNMNRKRSLAAIERNLSKLERKQAETLATPMAETAVNNMLCSLVLSADDQLCQQFGLPKVDWSDQQIAALRRKMLGPSQDTIKSVSDVLVEELRHIKGVLEISAQKDQIDASDIDDLKIKLLQITDTLLMINLKSLSETTRELTNKVSIWNNNTSQHEFAEAADTVLFIESSIQSLLRNEKTVEDLNDLSLQGREELLNRNQFAEAEILVLKEAESNIALSKRAITSYVDSNFDIAHIANVAVTLTTVRGGLNILNRERAANIVDKACQFIQKHIDTPSTEHNDRHKLIEILADALISLEYYIDQLLNTGKADDKILEIAEESLSQLGYSTA